MEKNEKILNLKRRLGTVLYRERLILFIAGSMAITAVLILTAILLSLAAAIVILPVWTKIGLLVLSVFSSIYFFWRFCFSRLFSNSDEVMALRLEKKYPQLKGRLIAALQFAAENRRNIDEYSAPLVEATLIQAERESVDLDFGAAVSTNPIWKNLRTMAISGLFGFFLLLLFPGFFTYSYEVWSSPTRLIAPPIGYRLMAYPGDDIAIKYRTVDLGGIITGAQFPGEASIYYRFSGGNWQKTDISLKDKTILSGSSGDSLLFYTTLKQVRRSLDYYVRAGRIITPVAHIDVVDRPRVTGIRTTLFYPDYTGLEPAVIDENDGSISAVLGTRVSMKIETNVPVTIAEMIFGDSSRSQFELSGQTGHQSFRIDKDRNYYIHLVDKQGEVNPNPIEYYITAIPDEYPVLDVIRPGVDINLNEEMLIPIILHISDDYGFSSLQLKYSLVSNRRRGDETVAVLHFSDSIKTEGEIKFNWDVEPLRLMPSDYIVYHFELADNDRISGPKVSSSREYIARLPSLEEIIAQTEQEQSQNISKAEQFFKAHKDLSERLKNIVRKMEEDRTRPNQKLSWQHQKELQEIAAQEEKITEQIKETAEDLDKMIDRMQENSLSNRELLEKLSEIQKLFEKVATPEMKEARLKLMEALKLMDMKKLEEALKDFQLSQEELMQRLDRTIALLRRMEIEQKINSMAEMAKHLAEKQEQVNRETEKSPEEKLPSLSPEERKIQKGFDNLKKEAAKLKEMFKNTGFAKPEDTKEFLDAVEKSDADKNMEQMDRELQRMAKQQARLEGEQAYSKLLKMADQMKQGQEKMCSGGGKDAAKKIRAAINDLNYLCNGQEEIINNASGITIGSEVLRDLAAQQQVLRESVGGLAGRISELGNESPFVAAELNSLIKQAIGNIDLAIDQFSNRRRQEGVNYQREALYNLNRSAISMLKALESQNNCNKGGSCNKPSLKMGSLAEQQQLLNRQTQSQCQNQGSNPSLSDTDAMRRLAAEQNAIGKSLGQLQNEFGQSKEILGRLDAIREDMEKVADALANGEVGQDLLNRQLKIYSRMLDATRTMQRKDFTDQRRARIGEEILRNSPPALSGNHLRGGLDIEGRLRQFLEEKYPEVYESHIKAYFKALLENSDFRLYETSDETD
ncbi:MAG TPA: hypothetical protein ENL22_09190 [candidate division Zixibacteria bacterium]|nr:hypothetical protein [candidate division Zixibacteria bacterium]